MSDNGDYEARMNARLREQTIAKYGDLIPRANTGSANPEALLSEITLPPANLAADERGAVWTDWPASWFADGGMSIKFPVVADDAALRSTLVFFDRIDVVQSNMIEMEIPSRRSLDPFGIVQSSQTRHNGDVVIAFKRATFDAFIALDGREPGRWSLARGAQALGIPSEELQPNHAISIAVENALPIFGKTVPLEDVLDFKRKRWAEVIALRAHLQGVCDQIKKEGPAGFEGSSAFKQFDRSLSDYVRAMAPLNVEKVWTSFKQEFDWTDAVPLAIQAALEHTIGASGLMTAGANIIVRTAKGLRKRTAASPFEYLASVNRALS